jgi:hypothetical protein
MPNCPGWLARSISSERTLLRLLHRPPDLLQPIWCRGDNPPSAVGPAPRFHFISRYRLGFLFLAAGCTRPFKTDSLWLLVQSPRALALVLFEARFQNAWPILLHWSGCSRRRSLRDIKPWGRCRVVRSSDLNERGNSFHRHFVLLE